MPTPAHEPVPVPAARPSIREVCLVGVGNASPRSMPERGWASGGRVRWSGRTYRVEEVQGRTDRADDPACYVHLSAVAEG